MNAGFPISERLSSIIREGATSDARYIVVVEKESVFMRLLEDRMFSMVPSILLCGYVCYILIDVISFRFVVLL